MLKKLSLLIVLTFISYVVFSQSTQGIKTKKVVADTVVLAKPLILTGETDSALYREPGTGAIKTKKISTTLGDTNFYVTHTYLDSIVNSFNFTNTFITNNNDTISGCNTSYVLVEQGVERNMVIDVIDSICGCFTVKNVGLNSVINIYSIQSFKIDNVTTYTLGYLEGAWICPNDTMFYVAADITISDDSIVWRRNDSRNATWLAYQNDSVGIGTNDPTEKLDVVGSAKISDELYLPGISMISSSHSLYYDTATGKITYQTAANQVITMAGAGITSVTGTYPGVFTITSTEVDGDVTNEAQTLIVAGTTTPTITLSAVNDAGGGVFTLTAGTNVSISNTNGNITIGVEGSGLGSVTSVAAEGGTGISVEGSPITSSGTFTITNTAPDQVVSIAGAGITSVTGTYPGTFTITSTEIDGDITNELQTISVSGTATPTISLSGGGGVFTITAGSNISISNTDNNITFSSTADASLDSTAWKRNDARGVTWLRYETDSVGIGTSTPTTTFSVKGTISYVPVVVDSAAIDATGITDLQPEIVFNDVNDVWYDWDSATNGPQIVGGEEGQIITIKSVGAGKMYLRNNSAHGDTVPAFVMYGGDNITLQYHDSTWWEVSRTDFTDLLGNGPELDNYYQDLSYSNGIVAITNGTDALLPLFSTIDTARGMVRGSNDVGSAYYLRADGQWAVPPGTTSATTYSFAYGLAESGGTVRVDTNLIARTETRIDAGGGLTGGGTLSRTRTITHSVKEWVDKSDLVDWVVPSNLTVDAYGHTTTWTTRTLPFTQTFSETIANTMTGTINYLSKFTPTGNKIGDSQIRDDGSTVGIGTAPAVDKLTVDGTITGKGYVNATSTTTTAAVVAYSNTADQAAILRSSAGNGTTSSSRSYSHHILNTTDQKQWAAGFFEDDSYSIYYADNSELYDGYKLKIGKDNKVTILTSDGNSYRLPETAGTAGQVATSGGNGQAMTWSNPTDGSITEIQTVAPIQGGPITSTGTITVDVFAGSTPGTVPTSEGGTSKYLRADGTWGVPAGTTTATTYSFSYGLKELSNVVSVDTSGADDPASKPWVTTHAANRYVPLVRSITINGNEQSLAANRTWNVGTVTSVNGTAGTGISVSGGPITTSGSLVITNTAPDQTVVINDGTGIDVVGTYPTFTINNTQTSNATHTGDATGATVLTLATVNSNVGTYNNVTVNAKGLVTAASNVSYLTSFTEVDGNVSNELQGLSYSNRNVTISSGGGTPNTINIPRFSTSDTASGFVKGSAGVGSSYFLNGSGNWAVPPDNNTTYSAGTGLQLSGTTFNNITRDSTTLTAGTNITVTGTRPNYIISAPYAQQPVLSGGGIVSVINAWPNYTITGTEVDGSITNELQSLSYTAASRLLTITSSTGVTLPLFSTSNTNAGLVPGSDAKDSSFYLNAEGEWTKAVNNYWGADGDDIYNLNTGNVTISKSLELPASSGSTGNIYKEGSLFLHTIGNGSTYTQTNLFIGKNAGNGSTTGYLNTAIGRGSMASIAFSTQNVAVGYNTMYDMSNAYSNVAVGESALKSVTTGSFNTTVGGSSMTSITTGAYNTAVGTSALGYIKTTNNNTAIGYSSGSNATGSNSVYVGANVSSKAVDQTNEIAIGYNVTGEGSNTVKIGNSSITDNYLNGDLHVTDQGIFGGTVTIGSNIFPTSVGADGTVLTNDGAGNLSWTTKEGTLTSTSGITSLNSQTQATQSFATNNLGSNVVLAIGSSGGVHTFTTSWTGDLAIADGGTGQSTKTEGFDALAPTTSTGDIIYHNGSDNIKLGIGDEGDVLKTISGVPSWEPDAFSEGDTSKWNSDGTNITNKNTGTVRVGTNAAVYSAKLEAYDNRTGVNNPAFIASSVGAGTTNIGGWFNASGAVTNYSLYTNLGDIFFNATNISTPGIPSTSGSTVQLVLDANSRIRTQTIASGGSVTSVGLAMPSQLTVSGSPVTTSGTLTAAWADTTANKLFAGPSSGGASKPRFRTMVAADIPVNTVDGTKLSLASENTGDIMYFNGTDWVRLGIGGNGQILKSNGTLPEWAIQEPGHYAVTLAASATTGGMSLNNQEIGFQAATTSQNGYLTSTDWNTFNGKVSSVSGSSPISSSGGANPTISITQASSIANGYLSSIDWTTFNNKMSNPMTTLGDIIYGGASGTPTRLGKGTPGQILATKADLSGLEWITPSAGTTYSAGYRIAINGSTIGNTSYWKDQDTVKTTLTGILKATAGKLSVAAAGVDYEAALTKGNLTASLPLSTGGAIRQVIGGSVNLSVADALADGSTKGVATFNANDFSTASAGVVTIDYTNGQKASGSQPGFLSSTDWTTFNNKVSSVSGTAPIVITGTTQSPTVTITQASTSTNGYLSSTDWNTFNNKENALTFNAPLSRVTNTISIPAATNLVNGYLSSSDWITFNAKIGGSGVLNYVPKFSGTSALSISMLYDNGSSISIDSAAATGYKLIVNADGSTGGINGSSFSGTGIYGKSQSGTGIYGWSSSGTGVVAQGSTGLKAYGTTAIESHGSLKLYNVPTGTPSSSDSGLYIASGTSTVYKAPWPSAGTNYWQRNSTYVSPATITDYVGIGTTNPSQQLEITGNFELPSSTSSVGIIYKDKDRFIHNYGTGSTYMGLGAGPLSLTGTYNVGIGDGVLGNNTSGTYNTGIGSSALISNTSGNQNTALGYYALKNNTTGYQNTAIGVSALLANTTGTNNIAVGNVSLYSNTTGYSNTAIGLKALNGNTTGYRNTAIGDSAFLTGTTYSNSTAIGYNAQVSSSNQMKLGNTSLRHVLTDGVIETTDSISIWKNNHYYRSEIVLDDDVSIVCPESWWGHGTILADYGATYASFRFSTTGTVTLLSDCTSDVDDADTDGKLCIIDSGSGITIKNRLGTSAILLITITYSTTEAP